MCRFNKNNNYSVKDISAALLEKFPGYFKNEAACIATIGPWIRRNNITPVNGQKNHRVFSGLDAQCVFDHECEIIRKRTGKDKPRKKSVTVPVKIAGSVIDTVKADKGFLTDCAGQMSIFDDGVALTVKVDRETVTLPPLYARYLRAKMASYPNAITDMTNNLTMIILRDMTNNPSVLFDMLNETEGSK